MRRTVSSATRVFFNFVFVSLCSAERPCRSSESESIGKGTLHTGIQGPISVNRYLGNWTGASDKEQARREGITDAAGDGHTR